MKTNKSFKKRLKITKKGKIIARKSGFNHFNARQSSTTRLTGRKGQEFTLSNKNKSRFLPYDN